MPGRKRVERQGDNLQVCLACGGPIAESLSLLGSLRCHDCRAANAELDPLRLVASIGLREGVIGGTVG